MIIQFQKIKISEIVDQYTDNQEEGVLGYHGLLNIRPKYQREFVYDEDKRKAVIDSILRDFPLSNMYWAKNNDNTFELLDGQQRTISICQYINGKFTVTNEMTNNVPMYFENLPEELKNKILNYELIVYICEGNESDKLKWFKVINIAGMPLTDQELLNATYSGPFITDAKRYFSKNNCVAYNLAKDYMSGSPIRQDYLQSVLRWISENKIEEYMAQHQNDENASLLWVYFQNVINWVKTIFPVYRREMKSIQWGVLYNKYKNEELNPIDIETKIKELMMDDDVTNKKGIYHYILSGDEKYLNIRAFTESQKRTLYEKQKGICPVCRKHFEYTEMEGDHITPWHDGGKTDISNLQMLCKECNRRKSGK